MATPESRPECADVDLIFLQVAQLILRQYLTSTMSPKMVSEICRTLFNCTSIPSGKEKHRDDGFHYHVGMLMTDTSKHTALKNVQMSFPKFEGRLLDLQFHKCWGIIARYVTEGGKFPYLWGNN